MITPEGVWIPDLFPKQFEVFNNYAPYTLVTGPRWSSKTVACLHRLVRHAWELPVSGRVLMMTPTLKNAVEGGIWSQIQDHILSTWMTAGINMRYTVEPRIHGSTRMNHFSINNHYGKSVQFQLGSLDYDFDIERMMKGKEYSAIFFSELDNFKDRIVFDASIQQLRMPGVPEHMFMWLADTNPAEEGTESWIWKLFYQERTQDQYPHPEFQKKLHLIEFTIDDNLSLSPQKKAELIGNFSHSPDLLARYAYGKWKASSRHSHFYDVFKAETHVLGNADAHDPSQWEIAMPQDGCFSLLSGWDLGTGRNHSAHIIEPISMDDGKPGFVVLDEITCIGEMISIEAFTEEFMERRNFWEAMCRLSNGRDVMWSDWSDNSAWVFRAASDKAAAFDHIQVMRASGGKVKMRAAPKFPGSRRKRLDLVRRLLFENRLFISARCKKTIEMFRMLRKGNTQAEPIADTWHRHLFDSMSYALAAECVEELSTWNPQNTQKASTLVVTEA